ncbi:MAG: class I SAM-dependent methyltransferase [Cyanobacteria bacterium]|nr:class I SAM-dependent methyltransferase [Cyanobacteriota bacterium]
MMKMDEYDGKAFLATVRGEDFAHAGETQSIDLVFQHLNAKPEWHVLDVGCGRGGTADYVQRHGWGQVRGADIDQESIDYAKQRYPELEFSLCSMEEVGSRFSDSLDLLYLFNVFYAAKDKWAATRSFRKATREGGLLCIFDYVIYDPSAQLPEVFLGQVPATLDEFEQSLRTASWKIRENVNIDREYAQWYQAFLERFDEPSLQEKFSPSVIEDVRKKYNELLSSIENGSMGGAIIIAEAC